MAPHRTPTGFVTVYQSVEKEQKCITTTLQVAQDSASGTNTVNVKAALPEYHTSPPWQLLWDDLKLFLKHCLILPLVVVPLWHDRRDGVHYPELDKAWVPRQINWGPVERLVSATQRRFQRIVDPYYLSGEMDELYPSVGNLLCLAAHGILIVAQLSFLLSLPFIATFPFSVLVPYVIAFIALNYVVCIPLNAGTSDGALKSQHMEWDEARHWDSLNPNKEYKEDWIFLNGVSVGSHWLQGNLNRLARTFHRPITGVHNKTAGIVFDTIQCLLERCFYFGTSDTRICYGMIAAALNRPEKEKVVLILHSQGGLEGSLILDWLLSNYSSDILSKLEIYTFGNAANHFNNPEGERIGRVVGHIEHYGNSGDFVAQWGVIHFKSLVAKQDLNRELAIKNRFLADLGYVLGRDKRQNNFSGLLFKNEVKGHLLNQHYLDVILPLNESLTGVVEEGKGKPLQGSFMDSRMRSDHESRKLDNEGDRVYQQSKLWKYINGRSPAPSDKKGSHGLVNGDHSH